MMEEGNDLHTIIEFGLAPGNKEKIQKFLKKIYNTSIDNPKIWEKKIFDFFSKELIVPYVVATSLYDRGDEVTNTIKEDYLGRLLSGKIIHWDSNECYRDLIRIKESIDTGKKIEDYAKWFFLQNNIIRKMFIKRTNEDDSRFKNFGVMITPITHEITSSGGVVFETVFFIIPDKDVDYPIKEWHKIISSEWRLKLKNKFKSKNTPTRKRNPIESRLRHEVFKRDNYKCKECGKGKETSTLHADHIIPVAQGGSDELDNLQTLCQACNLAKSNKMWVGGKNG